MTEIRRLIKAPAELLPFSPVRTQPGARKQALTGHRPVGTADLELPGFQGCETETSVA